MIGVFYMVRYLSNIDLFSMFLFFLCRRPRFFSCRGFRFFTWRGLGFFFFSSLSYLFRLILHSAVHLWWHNIKEQSKLQWSSNSTINYKYSYIPSQISTIKISIKKILLLIIFFVCVVLLKVCLYYNYFMWSDDVIIIASSILINLGIFWNFDVNSYFWGGVELTRNIFIKQAYNYFELFDYQAGSSIHAQTYIFELRPFFKLIMNLEREGEKIIHWIYPLNQLTNKACNL